MATSSHTDAQSSSAVQREHGLERQLSERQVAMMAIGGAIGTGLFLGSALAVRLAGPAVVVSYLVGAVIAWLLLGALSEMAVAHPTAGSFGVYAEIYVSRWAGFAVRYTYWAAQCIAIGGEATAAAIYARWWLPHTPAWLWIVAFSLALIYINTRAVGSFGEFEYWFATIKVVAIILFIVFGVIALGGFGLAPAVGLHNLTAWGGFFPKGFKGAWMALAFVIFSYIGTEVVGVSSGEAVRPEKTIPRAMRSVLARLILFYVGATTILVGVVPWNQIQPGADVTASPFVRVFQLMGIPAAAWIWNFVVLSAALSSMNTNLYMVARVMFSLSRAGYAPARFGGLSPRGTPVQALLISGAGLMLAAAVAFFHPRGAYVILFGIALFGGLFAWIMIFVTHVFFRRPWETRETRGGPRPKTRMAAYPYASLLGLVLLLAILLTTWWVEGMRVALLAGLPWLGLISVAYAIWRRKLRPAPPLRKLSPGPADLRSSRSAS